MGDRFWVSDERIKRLPSFFPENHGRPRAYERRVLSGIFSSTATACGDAMRLTTAARKSRHERRALGGFHEALLVQD